VTAWAGRRHRDGGLVPGAIEAIGLGRTGRKSPTLQWHKRGKHDHQSTGWQRQGKASRGGKLVRIWAVEDDWDAANLRSNMFEMEVPPRSGHMPGGAQGC